MLKDRIKRYIRILENPSQSYKEIERQTLEETVGDYVVILLCSGLASSVAYVLYMLANALVYNVFASVTVRFDHLINYSLTIGAGVFFFYLFAGTLFVFLAACILRIFLKTSLSHCIKLICYCLSPVLLLGWLSNKLAVAFLIWSGVILFVGIKESRRKSRP